MSREIRMRHELARWTPRSGRHQTDPLAAVLPHKPHPLGDEVQVAHRLTAQKHRASEEARHICAGFETAQHGHLYRPVKKQITLRQDPGAIPRSTCGPIRRTHNDQSQIGASGKAGRFSRRLAWCFVHIQSTGYSRGNHRSTTSSGNPRRTGARGPFETSNPFFRSVERISRARRSW